MMSIENNNQNLQLQHIIIIIIISYLGILYYIWTQMSTHATLHYPLVLHPTF